MSRLGATRYHMKTVPGWLRGLLRLEDQQLSSEFESMSAEVRDELTGTLPPSRLLALAQLDPGDDAEARQHAWAWYLDKVPFLILTVVGVETSR